MGRISRAGALISACGFAVLLGAASSADAAVRLGAAPALPAGARTVGAVAAVTPMHVTVTLQPQDPAGLESFATEVSTPGSPMYGHYIAPAQFAQQFGATADQVQAVESSLRAHGLDPGPVSTNSLSIPVDATAGALSQAFSTSFSRVALPDGTSAITNQRAPSLDAGVASHVQAVLGLDTLSTAKPLLVRPHATAAPAPQSKPHVVTGGPQPCIAASQAGASQGGYTADQIASAYGASGLYESGGPGGQPDEGAGQTVAILELESYDRGDIAAFEQCYGVNAPVANVPVDGGAGSGPGSGEAALDIENVIGLAPNASIAVFEGPNSGTGPYDTFNAIISQDAAQVVSASWGQCEPLEGFSQAAAENTLFQEAAAQGMSIVSASGDDGSEDCYPFPPTLQVDDPASQPFVTGVGGTSLTGLGSRPTESIWNDGPGVGAGGGGVSSFWSMPAYQLGAPSFLHVINSNSSRSNCSATSGDCREVPDVSADGDPATGYMIYWNGSGTAPGVPPAPKGWQAVGGTSGAAPTWAALIALANASSTCNGRPIGFANPALYEAAATAYSRDFNDVTSGDNDMTGLNSGMFPGGSGYDMASGLGTPNASALAVSLCTDAIALSNPGPQRSTVRTAVSLQINAQDTHRLVVTYKAAGLPNGLTINSSSGKITGRPQKIATSTVTITVSDVMGTTTQTTFKWTIQGAPTLSHVSLSSVGAARPRLSFTVTSGRGAPELQSVNVALPRGLHFTKSRSTVTLTGRRGRQLKFTVSLQHGALVLKLRSASPQVDVTVSSPRIAASGGFTSALARHRATRVTLTVRVTDADKLITRLSAKTKPS
jgi:subtilase family serine protease